MKMSNAQRSVLPILKRIGGKTKNTDMKGFCEECKTRYMCYDGLICTWDYDAAFAKALKHDDWRVFVIAQWWIDEQDAGGGEGDGVSVDAMNAAALSDGAKTAIQAVRLLNALGVKIEDPEDNT